VDVMSQTTAQPYQAQFSALVEEILSHHPDSDISLIEKAFQFTGEVFQAERRDSGEKYVEHCLATAHILAELNMDIYTVVAGLLHEVIRNSDVTLAHLKKKFGKDIGRLITGIADIYEKTPGNRQVRQIKDYRKMLLAVAKDLRVILIKFASYLDNLRTAESLPEEMKERLARETLDIYAPLAHRLGVAQIKWEMEDLAFRILQPDLYHELEQKIAIRQADRQAYIDIVKGPLLEAFTRAGISAQIMGRPKHLYSIYNKMQRQHCSFEEIYDLFALRVIVDRIEHCYSILGTIHSLFKPIEHRFKDFIAMPKANGYQSVHTTVMGPQGRRIEIQIRTRRMHETAESGIAAHYRYKEKTSGADELDQHVAWIRQLLEHQETGEDTGDFLDSLKVELFKDEVFVFTPEGDLISLPQGSTPVDFAFAIHTQVGLRCHGAKINQRIVPLSTELQNGDSVEILTSKTSTPHPDWLSFAKCAKARGQIKKWIKESRRDQSIKLGMEILDRELKVLKDKPTVSRLEAYAKAEQFNSLEDLHHAVGNGDISARSVRNHFHKEEQEHLSKSGLLRRMLSRRRKSAGAIRLQGVGNLMISFAKCCQPVPGDQIRGYISPGKGVVIHRANCRNIKQLKDQKERIIKVEWDITGLQKFIIGIEVRGIDRKNFLRDVTEAVSFTQSNIVGGTIRTEDQVAINTFLIEVNDLQSLNDIIQRIKGVQGVQQVHRLNVEIDQ